MTIPPPSADSPQSVNGISSHEEEEISELQDDDRELFSDQLSSIGMLGRVAADHCIPLLTRFDLSRTVDVISFQCRQRRSRDVIFAACWRTG